MPPCGHILPQTIYAPQGWLSPHPCLHSTLWWSLSLCVFCPARLQPFPYSLLTLSPCVTGPKIWVTNGGSKRKLKGVHYTFISFIWPQSWPDSCYYLLTPCNRGLSGRCPSPNESDSGAQLAELAPVKSCSPRHLSSTTLSASPPAVCRLRWPHSVSRKTYSTLHVLIHHPTSYKYSASHYLILSHNVMYDVPV